MRGVEAFREVVFVGGTCLRLMHGLRRSSEDLDFGNLIEQSLRKVLLDSPSSRDSSKHWVQDLPRLSASAAADLDAALNIPDFRTVEPEMWK